MKICSRKAQKIINKDGVKGKNVIGDSSDFVLDYCPPGIKVHFCLGLNLGRRRVTHTTKVRLPQSIKRNQRIQ